jgi:hypothetical protein
MKQRITYVVTNPESFTPEQLKVYKTESHHVFSVNGVQAAKEHRFTFGLDELPSQVCPDLLSHCEEQTSEYSPDPLQLSTALQQWHELHVRWASSTPYMSTPPFTSRVSPGLHVFFTPLKTTPKDVLCIQLHSLIALELKCSSNETSIKMPILSERFSMSASSQYYSSLPSIESSIEHFSNLICLGYRDKCEILFNAMRSAAYLDVDYDTITRALVVNVGWSSAPRGSSWNEEIYRGEKDGTIEIGVLNHEPNPDPEDIQFGGFLTVLGQDGAPSTSSPSVTPQHHPS